MPNLSKDMLAVLRDEIKSDPMKRGYDTDPQKTADLLNASFTIVGAEADVPQDVASHDIQKIIVPTGELYDITRLGETVPSGDAAKDAAIKAAWSFSHMLLRWDQIETSNPAVWAASQQSMELLIAAGVLSKESAAAISALVVRPLARSVMEHHPRGFEVFIQRPDIPLPDDFTTYEVTAEDVKEALS